MCRYSSVGSYFPIICCSVMMVTFASFRYSLQFMLTTLIKGHKLFLFRAKGSRIKSIFCLLLVSSSVPREKFIKPQAVTRMFLWTHPVDKNRHADEECNINRLNSVGV